MFLPSLPRNVEASFRDLSSLKADTRRSALADVVRHSLADEAQRARAIPLLEKRLRDDESAEVRAAAAVALTDLSAHEALPSLLLSVEDAHPMVRQMAINALGEIGDARGESRLRRALKDPRSEVRYQAVIAYARVAKDADDVSRALSAALSDVDDAVQHIALRIAEERVDARLPVSSELVEVAAKKLTATHADVVTAAAILLGKLHDERANATLAKVVRGDGIGGIMPAKEEEQAAVELAGILGQPDLVVPLERRAWGFSRHFKDTCAFSAQVALAAMGDARAQAAIIDALSAKQPAARRNAIVACGRAKIEGAREALNALKAGDDADLARDALASLNASDLPRDALVSLDALPPKEGPS